MPGRRASTLTLRILVVVVVAAPLVPVQAASVPGLPDVEHGDIWFGANFVEPQEPWLTLAWEGGVRTVRTQLSWRDVEPTPGERQWDSGDWRIDAWAARGFRVHGILTLPPDWAKASESGLMPRNINLPWDHPDNYWARFCHDIAARYKGKVQSYELWNEPDLDLYWEGTAQEYYLLMRSGYQAIKAADPDATVIMAGMAILAEPYFFPEVVRLAATDPEGPEHNHFFDAASIHAYGDPELVYDLIRDARDVLDENGMYDQGVWLTETNVPLWGIGDAPDGPQAGYATEEEAGWYMLQAMGNALAAGAACFMVFRFNDGDMDTAFGVLDNEGQPRPAYRAFQIGAAFLYDVVEARREEQNGLIIVRIRRADGGRVTLAWSEDGDGASLSLEPHLAAGLLVDAGGRYGPLLPSDDLYTLDLPAVEDGAGRRSAVGGPPLLLVEADRTPPTATVSVSSIPADEERILVQWDGEDDTLGTGIASYDVQVSHNGGLWQVWLGGTTRTEEPYTIGTGGTFAFRARATDYAGNVGRYPETAQAVWSIHARLLAQVINLRGEPVPFARLETADGRLHDADETGLIILDGLPPGEIGFREVDGSAQGVLSPPPLELALGGETTVTWILEPLQNLLVGGTFDRGLYGWEAVASPGVQVVDARTGPVLQVAGGRMPWGAPAASTTFDVPPGMADAVLSFRYRLLEGGGTLRLRVIAGGTSQTLWQTDTAAPEFERVWFEMGDYAGETITLSFELWGPKGSPGGLAQIDDVILGSVPPLGGG